MKYIQLYGVEMTTNFICIIEESGKVHWKFGVDSHSELATIMGIEDVGDLDVFALLTPGKENFEQFEEEIRYEDENGRVCKGKLLKYTERYPTKRKTAKVSIYLCMGSFRKPRKWKLTVDEETRPAWWSGRHANLCHQARREWYAEVKKYVVDKKIKYPFSISPPVITDEVVDLLRQWAIIHEVIPSTYGIDSLVDESIYEWFGESLGKSIRDPTVDLVREEIVTPIMLRLDDSLEKLYNGAPKKPFSSPYIWLCVIHDLIFGQKVEKKSRLDHFPTHDSLLRMVPAYNGSFFNLPREAWKRTHKIKCDGYPFQPVVDLWEMGLVTSYVDGIWRLHGGPDGAILFEIANYKLCKNYNKTKDDILDEYGTVKDCFDVNYGCDDCHKCNHLDHCDKVLFVEAKTPKHD